MPITKISANKRCMANVLSFPGVGNPAKCIIYETMFALDIYVYNGICFIY